MDLTEKNLNTLNQINKLIETLSKEEILLKKDYVGKNTYEDFSYEQKQIFDYLYNTVRNSKILLYLFSKTRPMKMTVFKNKTIKFEASYIENIKGRKQNIKFISFINKNNNIAIEFEYITKKESSLSRINYLSKNRERDNFFDADEKFLDIEHTELTIYIDKFEILKYHLYKTIKDDNIFIEKYGNLDELDIKKITDIDSALHKYSFDMSKKSIFLKNIVFEYNSCCYLIEINYFKNSPIYMELNSNLNDNIGIKKYGLTQNDERDIYNMIDWINELTENTIIDIYQKLTSKQKKRTLIKTEHK